MAKKRRKKFKLIRDQYQDRIPPDEWERLKKGGKRHKQYLRWKLQEEVDEFKASGYMSMEEMADILEVLRCIAWFNNWDWNAVEQARWDKMVKKGKFLEGILLTVSKGETEENPDGGGRTDEADDRNQGVDDGEILDRREVVD